MQSYSSSKASKNLHLLVFNLVFLVWLLEILNQYAKKCKFFLFFCLYIKASRHFEQIRIVTLSIKIKESRFFASLKRLSKGKNHPHKTEGVF